MGILIGGIRDPQTTLQQYYTLRDDLITGKVASYSLGDRQITLQDLPEIEGIIHLYENVVASAQPIYTDISGVVHNPPWPEG